VSPSFFCIIKTATDRYELLIVNEGDKDVMEKVVVKSLPARIKKVRKLILSAGNTIGSVHFRKRSDGSRRRMCYRLHSSKPTYATKPTGKMHKQRVAKDSDNFQMTVLDCNKVVRDKKGRISGRGAWRTIPLENVERVCVRGKIYKIATV